MHILFLTFMLTPPIPYTPFIERLFYALMEIDFIRRKHSTSVQNLRLKMICYLM